MFLPSHRFSHGGKFVALASNVAPTSRLQTVEDVTLLTSVAVIKCVTKNSAVVTKFDQTRVFCGDAAFRDATQDIGGIGFYSGGGFWAEEGAQTI